MNKTIGTDVEAWKEGRVPSDVREVMCFVFVCRSLTHHEGPSWAEIIEHMNWEHLPRSVWRSKFKRMRRWGLRWELNKPGSTSISRAALPYVREIVGQSIKVSA